MTTIATYGLRSDDVLSLSLVESGDTLDDHVVTLGRSTRKDDIFRASTNQLGDMLSSLVDRSLGLPSVRMRPTMRVSVLLREKWQHLVKYSRVHGCRSLHIEVDRSPLGLGIQTSLGCHLGDLESKHF